MHKFLLILVSSLQLSIASTTLTPKKSVSLNKLGVKKELKKDNDKIDLKLPPTLVTKGMEKIDHSVKEDGFSVSPNNELLKSLYDNKGDVLKSINQFELTAPPVNAEYKISF